MTREEFKKLKKSMKDEKFHELLGDYMKEISDPKNMAEYDQYLEQLKSEGELPEVGQLLTIGHGPFKARSRIRHQEFTRIEVRPQIHSEHLYQHLLTSSGSEAFTG